MTSNRLMTLTGLHLLLTYRCTMACDHCFVWSSPELTATMTLQQVRQCLKQGRDLGTVRSVYFEGGEPFLVYPILVKGAREASEAGFSVGIVSNAFWATSVDDAVEWLRPFVGLLDDLSLSKDAYHWDEEGTYWVQNAREAALQLNIPVGIISISLPEDVNPAPVTGQLPPGESRLMYRGRAAKELSHRAIRQAFDSLNTCPFENLSDPGRVHVDPYGYIHLCQGIVLGNLFDDSLDDILSRFDPEAHPIVGPILQGGPAMLARRYRVEHDAHFADACHLCCEARESLRLKFPEILRPDEMYGGAAA